MRTLVLAGIAVVGLYGQVEATPSLMDHIREAKRCETTCRTDVFGVQHCETRCFDYKNPPGEQIACRRWIQRCGPYLGCRWICTE